MIKSFVYYETSNYYFAYNASYLLFVDLYFRVPIVKSNDKFLLIECEASKKDNINNCLSQDILKKTDGKVDDFILVCETNTIFNSNKLDDIKTSHDYFLYAENLNISTIFREDIELYWLSFSDAISQLTFEYQKWALQYFRSILKSLTNKRVILDSINFIEGLTSLDAELVRSVPKSDLHNHAVFGGSQHDFESITGKKVKQLKFQLNTFEDFSNWCDEQVSNHFRSREGFLKRIEAALITAKNDNITKLCFNIGVCSMKFFSSSDDLISNIELLRNKHFLGRDFFPELCLDRQKATDKQYQQWFYDLLQSRYFKSIDLTGDELASLEPVIPMFMAAEKLGLILKAHVAEYSNYIVAKETAKCLHLTQIQHGNTLADDTEAIKWLYNSKIQLNMCPSSNYYLARIDDITNHPIKKLFRNGVKVTINSDDILIFGRTVTEEFLELYKKNVLSAEELNQIRIWGLE